MELLRLDMLVSKALEISRKDAKAYLSKGRIKIDGTIYKKGDLKFPEDTVVEADGKKYSFVKHLYILQNKPLGIVSSTDDHDGETVLDILPEELKRKGLFPAGRLDKYSHGMMIITDDGEFAHRMLAPVSHVEKEYFVEVDKPIVDENLVKEFNKGVFLGDGKYSSPAEVKIVSPTKAYVTIHEGIYHQVRRMFKNLGGTVIDLKRVRIGMLKLDESLKEGESRLLSDSELDIILTKKSCN